MLNYATQIHAMALMLMAVYLVFGIKQYKYRPAGFWNLALVLGIFAYSLRVQLIEIAPAFGQILNSIEYMTPIFFMICVRVNFDDDFVFGPVEKYAVAVVGILAILFAARDYLGTADAFYVIQMRLQFLLDALAVVWAYWCIFRTWSADLDQRRRIARIYFVIGIGPVVAIVIALYVFSINHQSFATYVDLVVSCAIIIMGSLGLIFFIDINPSLFGQHQPIETANQDDINHPLPVSEQPSAIESEPAKNANESALTQLEHVMQEQGRFKEMGINLSSLAEYVQMPEYRLRALINKDLGYRNFNAYLNHYRVAHACHLLKNKACTDSILEVSLECGYKSLSTFNKAFKDITSLTPSEYRKKFS